jgi:hypothetical protein
MTSIILTFISGVVVEPSESTKFPINVVGLYMYTSHHFAEDIFALVSLD